MLHQPVPEAKPDVLAGILAIRKMIIIALYETGLTSADGMLILTTVILSDLAFYVAIMHALWKIRHRLMVSGLDIPVGMKNPTSGDFSVMLNSVVAAQGGYYMTLFPEAGK